MIDVGAILLTLLLILGTMIAAIYRPLGGRIIFGFGYILAAIVNAIIGFTDPASYIVFADTALLPAYTDIWYVTVVPNLSLFLTLTVLFQIIVGVLILSRGILANLGFILGAIFCLAIIPANPWTLSLVLLLIAQVFLSTRRWDDTFIEDMQKPGEPGSAPSTFRHRSSRFT